MSHPVNLVSFYSLQSTQVSKCISNDYYVSVPVLGAQGLSVMNKYHFMATKKLQVNGR